jgi:hypothetical protein
MFAKPIRSIRGRLHSLRKGMKQSWQLRRGVSPADRKIIEDVAEKKFRQGRFVTGIWTGDNPKSSRTSRRMYTELDDIRGELKGQGFSKKERRLAYKELYKILTPSAPDKRQEASEYLDKLRNDHVSSPSRLSLYGPPGMNPPGGVEGAGPLPPPDAGHGGDSHSDRTNDDFDPSRGSGFSPQK